MVQVAETLSVDRVGLKTYQVRNGSFVLLQLLGLCAEMWSQADQHRFVFLKVQFVRYNSSSKH